MEASAAVIALVIGACVALIAAGLARRAAGSATRGALKKPPGPPGRHWLLRDLPSIIRYVKDEGLEPDEIMQRWQRAVGRVFTFDVINIRMTVLSEPDAVKDAILVKQLAKSPTYGQLRYLIGSKSMLTQGDAEWSRTRKAFVPAFSTAFLKTLVPLFVARAQIMADKLQGVADARGVAAFHPLATLLTMDIIALVVLSHDADLQRQDPAAPHPLFASFMELLRLTSMLMKNGHLVFVAYLPWVRWRIWRHQRALNNYLTAIIRERIAAAAAGEAPQPLATTVPLPPVAAERAPSSLWSPPASRAGSALGDHSSSSSSGLDGGGGGGGAASTLPPPPPPRAAFRDILSYALDESARDGGALDLEECLSQVKTFLFAGHDTTATLISWVVYELSRAPAAEAAMVAELRRVVGGGGGVLVADALGELRYVGAVLKEALRLWPPASTARWAPHGTTLAGYDVGGTVVYPPNWVLQRDPELWGPDAEEFKPERWLLEPSNKDGGGAKDGAAAAAAPKPAADVHPWAYLPFSRGPRDCIGQAFALMEAKALLCELYRRFSFEYAGAEPERTKSNVTNTPKGGVPVRVVPRRDAF